MFFLNLSIVLFCRSYSMMSFQQSVSRLSSLRSSQLLWSLLGLVISLLLAPEKGATRGGAAAAAGGKELVLLISMPGSDDREASGLKNWLNVERSGTSVLVELWRRRSLLLARGLGGVNGWSRPTFGVAAAARTWSRFCTSCSLSRCARST